MFKTKNPAIQIIGDPAATEDQWIPACAAVEREYQLAFREQRAGAIGWLGAFIDSTMTAVAGAFLIATSARALSSLWEQSSFWPGDNELIPVLVAVPFAFSFIYGLWMEHYKGGKAWIVGYFVPAVFVLLVPTLLMLSGYPANQNFIFMAVAISGGLTGLRLGTKFFQRLKLIIKPWNVIGIGQLSMLAYPLTMFIFRESNMLLPVFVSISFMIGMFTSFTAKGQSQSTTMMLAMAAIAMPVLMTVTVLIGMIVTATAYTNPQHALGVCASLASFVGLTLGGAATGHWFLRYAALPDGTGGFKFDDPYLVRSVCSVPSTHSTYNLENDQSHDDNQAILASHSTVA